MNTLEILTKLRNSRVSRDEIILPEKSGVYAIFLNKRNLLGDIPASKNDIIYIGETKDLKERKHFSSDNTGFSTLRRSLGAILNKELNLIPIPRSENSKKNFYKFLPNGEERLTDWMYDNLDISVVTIMVNYKEIQNELIELAEPVLNLTNWPNPYRKKIKNLRKVMTEEAQRNR